MTHDYKEALNDINTPYTIWKPNEDFKRHAIPDKHLDTIRAALQLAQEAEQVKRERDELAAQLPEGMKHCTIVFEECPVGHGHLRGTNWVKSMIIAQSA